jgi:hypothetical protein
MSRALIQGPQGTIMITSRVVATLVYSEGHSSAQQKCIDSLHLQIMICLLLFFRQLCQHMSTQVRARSCLRASRCLFLCQSLCHILNMTCRRKVATPYWHRTPTQRTIYRALCLGPGTIAGPDTTFDSEVVMIREYGVTPVSRPCRSPIPDHHESWICRLTQPLTIPPTTPSISHISRAGKFFWNRFLRRARIAQAVAAELHGSPRAGMRIQSAWQR